MECETFFARVQEHLADHYEEPTWSTPGDQCVAEFFHPRIVERLGTKTLATRFNRSGVVWQPSNSWLGVTIRVPATHEQTVSDVLDDAPLEFDQTDHRGVSTPDGTVVTILHYSTQETDVSADQLEATLSAVEELLAA